MSETLKSIPATVDSDGTVHLSQPVKGPAMAMVTILQSNKDTPNTETLAAMREPVGSLPRFETVDALLDELNSPE